MLRIGFLSALLATVALQARAQEAVATSTSDVSLASELGDIVEISNEESLSSTSRRYMDGPMYYPFGILADAQYKVNFEIIKTKSDVGPARYNIDMDGACAKYTPEPETYTYYVPEGYESGSGYWGSRHYSDDEESDTRSWVPVTRTYTPYYEEIACSGAYQAAYSDSASRYVKTVKYASQRPYNLFDEPLTAFEDNPRPTWWYGSTYLSNGSSDEEYDTTKATPTEHVATSSAPATPTTTIDNTEHAELR
ncbi:hypothetical protein FBU59_000800 [Linderina macrospora]|uniref:Uncharacterized protein n=1 Tax=Linderina macrospora TaxID=4868 RepID=A0ACC1JFP4_9FUNG|nr:hypothetical protein FBU59_000800 [Linderina macrospora]